VNGAVVTFTPSPPWPGNTPIVVHVNLTGVNLTDLAGNAANFFGASFTTGAGPVDTTAPQVVLVTPGDGATGSGRTRRWC